MCLAPIYHTEAREIMAVGETMSEFTIIMSGKASVQINLTRIVLQGLGLGFRVYVPNPKP